MGNPSDKKTSQDQTRQALIEISYTSPEDDYISSSDVKPVINITNRGTKGNTGDAEKLRAELISISYNESPSPSHDVDVAVSPTMLNGICRG